MRASSSLLFVALLSACSFEPPPDVPDAPVDAAPDAAIDADTSCETDDFDGDTLQARWSMLVGELPTHDVSDSRLLLSDAPLAATASNPAGSWIYELDLDKGNQIGWQQERGGEDFNVEAELAWATSVPELTLAGIAIADADGAMAAVIGVNDASVNTTGRVEARIAVDDGADLAWYGATSEIGGVTVRIERRGGIAHLVVDGTEVVSGDVDALISYVTIYYVRHKGPSSGMVYPFGSAEVRRLTVCRSQR